MSDDEGGYSEEDEEEEVQAPPDVSSDEEDDAEEAAEDLGGLNEAADTRAIIVRAVRRTSNVITAAEFARVVGIRATQIDKSGIMTVDPGDLSDSRDIALKEIREGKCPLVVRRPVGRTPKGEAIVEKWSVNELAIPASIKMTSPLLRA